MQYPHGHRHLKGHYQRQTKLQHDHALISILRTRPLQSTTRIASRHDFSGLQTKRRGAQHAPKHTYRTNHRAHTHLFGLASGRTRAGRTRSDVARSARTRGSATEGFQRGRNGLGDGEGRGLNSGSLGDGDCSLTILDLEVIGSDKRTESGGSDVLVENPGTHSDAGGGEVGLGGEGGALGVEEDDVAGCVR